MTNLINIKVNGIPVEVEKGAYILDAVKKANVKVPTLCNVEGLSPTGACRMCVVELENGGRLVPSCSFPAEDGMSVLTHSPRVRRARKTIVELLLTNHPDDCLYCVKNCECELQNLAYDLGVRERRYKGEKRDYKSDLSGKSIERDPAKCILCGRCVRVCEEVQGVGAIDFTKRGVQTIVLPAFNKGLNISNCVNCGQCIIVCPTGALREKSSLKEVWNAINDKDKHVVVQVAPSISVTIGEEFGFPVGVDVSGKLASALKRLGFTKVFDTCYSADLTIMEEANELVERIKNKGVLPMITSCSPGWVKFMEHNLPEFMPNVSSCKSPQQMAGVVFKTYYAKKAGIDPSKIFTVSIMPCVAKKFEAARPEMNSSGYQDVDAVLTTREITRMIKLAGLHFNELPDSEYDNPFGEISGAGKIFGVTGGVMEAAIRTAYYFVTGKELENIEVKSVRGFENVKESSIDIDGIKINVAVVHGLLNAKAFFDRLKKEKLQYHFIEVMGCPGGCIGGGGQPYGTNVEQLKARMKALYSYDKKLQIRRSHQNPEIKMLYEEYLEKPGSEKAHHLLHTHYHKRDKR